MGQAPTPVAKSAHVVQESHASPTQSPTYMTDLVSHANPKKRDRRVAAASTVLGPAFVQKGIRGRALFTSGRASPSTQAMPEPTPPFRESALGRRGQDLYIERDNPRQGYLLATQAFETPTRDTLTRLQASALMGADTSVRLPVLIIRCIS